MLLHLPLPRAICKSTPSFEAIVKPLFTRSVTRRGAARLLGVSESAFYRRFPEVFQITFQQAKRVFPLVTASHWLLKDSNLPITRIVEELGYCDHNTFGRLFREFWNMSPLAFRKRFHRMATAPWIKIHALDRKRVRLEIVPTAQAADDILTPGVLLVSQGPQRAKVVDLSLQRYPDNVGINFDRRTGPVEIVTMK